MSGKATTDHGNAEWVIGNFARARPASELPAHIRAAFRRTRGPQKTPTRVPVSIRPGRQSRIDEAPRKLVEA